MNLWSGGSGNHSSGRSRGHKAGRPDGTRGGRGSSRRNPLTAPATDEEAAALAARRREEEALSLSDLGAAPTSTPDRDSRHARKHHVSGNERAATTTRAPFGLTHVAFLLIGLALGAALLVSLQHLHTVVNRSREEKPKQEAVVVSKPLPPFKPVAVPEPARLATDPVEAIRLMLKAAAAGDTATAYAQWDIEPDELATLRRGQELTVAEVVSKAQTMGDSVQPERTQYRLIGGSGGEARVAQYDKGVCAQVFSLRRRGPHWKLYNVSTP